MDEGEWYARLHELRRLKQWGAVEAWCRKRLDEQPDHYGAWSALGQALTEQCRLAEAAAAHEKAFVLASQHYGLTAEHYKRLDILYWRMGRYEDCLRVAQAYVAAYSSLDAWNRLRRAAAKLGMTALSEEAQGKCDHLKQVYKRVYRQPTASRFTFVPSTEEELEQASQFTDDDHAAIRERWMNVASPEFRDQLDASSTGDKKQRRARTIK